MWRGSCVKVESRWSPGRDAASAASTRCCWPSTAPRSSSTTSAANPDGRGADAGPAHEVVELIKGMGGEAVVNGDDISDMDGAKQPHRSSRRLLRPPRRR